MSKFDSATARQTLAKNVRRRRNELGISQESLADKAGLHRTYVGGIERGERNVSIDNIQKIAHALGVQVSFLLKEGN